MEVEIGEEQEQQLRDNLGELIAGQLLQKPNEALIVELLSVFEGG
jgi:hypothetical protein